jgi:hypothetical protein
MDPFQAGVEFVLGRLKQSAMALWLKLLFQIAVSMVGSYLLIFGTAIGAMAVTNAKGATHLDPAMMIVLARGAGSTAAALVLVNLIRCEQSKLLRGMTFIFPSAEATLELATDFEKLQKADSDQEKKS